MQDRSPAGLVFDADHNGVNDYSLKRGFEEACKRAEVVYGETKPGGIIWHDLRRTFATRLRVNGVHEYDIQDLLGHAKPGVTKVYARATLTVLQDAVDKLTEPWGEVTRRHNILMHVESIGTTRSTLPIRTIPLSQFHIDRSS